MMTDEQLAAIRARNEWQDGMVTFLNDIRERLEALEQPAAQGVHPRVRAPDESMAAMGGEWVKPEDADMPAAAQPDDDWLARAAAFFDEETHWGADMIAWVQEYGQRLIAAAKENAGLRAEADRAFAPPLAQCSVTWDDVENRETASDEVLALIGQLRADLAAAGKKAADIEDFYKDGAVKLADTERDLAWYMAAYNRERDEVDALTKANASNLRSCDKLRAERDAANEKAAELGSRLAAANERAEKAEAKAEEVMSMTFEKYVAMLKQRIAQSQGGAT